MVDDGNYSFDVLELLSELKFHKANAVPLRMLARNLDMPKRKVLKLINKARVELSPNVLIMNNGRDSYYMKGSLYKDNEIVS